MNLNNNITNNPSTEFHEKDTYGNYPDLSHVKHILVIACKNIGDVVLTSPVFNVLKKMLPDATIDVILNSGTEEVLMENPAIRKIHLIDSSKQKHSFFTVVSKFKLCISMLLSKYDLSVVLTTGYTAGYLAFLSGAKIRAGVGSRKKSFFGKKLLLLNFPVQHAPAHRHYIERNLDCLRKIGLFPNKSLKKTTFYPGEQAEKQREKLLTGSDIDLQNGYIVIHPTSRWMFKCWEHFKVAKLIDQVYTKLRTPVVLTSGPDNCEKLYIENLLSCLKSSVVNFSGSLSLRELGSLIQKAKLFIGVDSAPMHISCALNTPSIVLFGPSSELDWGPWGNGHRVITSNSYTCRPCNRDRCGGSKKSECLEDIDVQTVFTAVEEILERDSETNKNQK